MIGDAGRGVAEEIAFGELESKSKDMAKHISGKLREARDLVQRAEMILDGTGSDETIWDDDLNEICDAVSDLSTDIDALIVRVERV